MSETKKTIVTVKPTSQDIFITREFNAPKELVQKAHVDPKLVLRWYGCGGMKSTIKEFEPRTGGHYRYFQVFDNGMEFTVHGSYHEVVDGRIVRTSEFSGYPGRCLMETTTFEALPGNRTLLTNQFVFQSIEDRDAMVRAGVEMGATQTHLHLEALLEELKNS